VVYEQLSLLLSNFKLFATEIPANLWQVEE
jgi:hypothetical protein